MVPLSASPRVPLPLLALLFLLPITSASYRGYCRRCPRGYLPYGPACVKRGVRCGPRHLARLDACYKRHKYPAMSPRVRCRRGHERQISRCFRPCARGYHADFDACVRRGHPAQAYHRRAVPPLRSWCPRFRGRRYWRQGRWCRTACPRAYEWTGVICRARGCPRGTGESGSVCQKPRARCLRRVGA